MRHTIPALMLFLLATAVPRAADVDDAVCITLVDDERVQLADYELDVELAGLRLAAFEKIYELVDGLWKHEAIQRMTWVEARHDRDAARLQLARARLIQERQKRHVEQIELGCTSTGEDRAQRIEEARRQYLQANCDQQAKAIEVAEIDLEFAKEWLAAIRALREGKTGTSTAQDVILAELDVELEKQRLADAKARTAACRKSDAR